MLKILSLAIISIAYFMPMQAEARYYGQRLCNTGEYKCVRVRGGDSWHRMFPNARERDLVKRLNRMNTRLRRGMKIAVPRNLRNLDVMDISPYPHRIAATGRKTIVFKQSKLAWAAYDANGRLVRWGPAAGGRNYCPDVRRGCRTVKGNFSIYHVRGAGCKSSKYPIGRGGAPMPYCMFFRGGYAFHGSPSVPGYHASHGCVRIFTRDARWLHQNFIDLPWRNGRSTRVKIS